MEKATIIYGEGSCGKTTLARMGAADRGCYFYGSARELSWIKANLTNPFKTIIIDECPKDFDFIAFFNLITDLPQTKFIFVTNTLPSFKECRDSLSFAARFDLIDAKELWDDLPF